jgi:hypothetical protein
VIKYETDKVDHDLPNIARSTRAMLFGHAQTIAEDVSTYSVMHFSIGRRLGRPLGFPDVPLTNRVAIPPSCSLPYRPADFDSDGSSIWDSSNESVMGPSKGLVVGGACKYQHSPRRSLIEIGINNYVRRAQDLNVAGPHMPKGMRGPLNAPTQQRFRA